MSNFTPTRKTDPCPICSDVSGKCRSHQGGEIFLCMAYSDSRLGESVNKHKCIKQNQGKGWSTWKIDNSAEWTEEQRLEWQLRNQQRKARLEIEESQRQATALLVEEKDKQYRKLLAELPLEDDDRKDLKNRDFTDQQIDLCGFKSVKQWQKLRAQYSHLLPGINPGGYSIITQEGYLVPVKNAEGLIVAMQVRLKAIAEGKGRYSWLSSHTKKCPNGQTPHVYPNGCREGELPLAIHRSPGKAQAIALTEGTGTKPFLTSQRLNRLVIGAAGGQWESSPITFRYTLNKLQEELGIPEDGKQIEIYPDAGDILNSQVMTRWQRVVALLSQWGWNASIQWWGQVDKTHPDIDELTDFSQIRSITPDEFWAIAQNPEVAEARKKAKDKDKNQKDWLNKRKFTPNWLPVDQQKFRFPSGLPEHSAIIAVRSGLATGKTEATLERVNAIKRAIRLIGYRNNLLFQTINRGNEIGVQIYHLREDGGIDLVADLDTHQAFCLDSILHVDGYFKGTDIYIDEAVSVLLHAVCGGTLGDNQAKILKVLTKALQECNNVYLLDANLADIYVNFVSELAPNKQVIKILNEYEMPAHNIIFIEGIDADDEIKKRDKSSLLKAMSAQDCVPWIATDSLQRSKVLDAILKGQGKLNGYVLNSETSGEKWAKEFLENPNQFIIKYKPDYIIISPTAESGISVTINNYFTAKFSFFSGVLGTNSQIQMMFRLRDNSIPHYVFCPEKSMVRDRSKPVSYFEREYKKAIEDKINLSAMLAAYSSDNPEKALEIINAATLKSDPHWSKFACLTGTIDNYEMDNLRECLIYALEKAGNKVEAEKWEINQEFSLKEKEAKQEIEVTLATELNAAIPFDTVEEAKQEKKKSPNKHTQRRIKKTFLLDRLPGIKNSEAWGTDLILHCYVRNREFINQQQRFYFLNNTAISSKRHECDWYYKTTQEDVFTASLKQMNHLIIWALQELGLKEFIEKFQTERYYKHTPEVLEIVKKFRDRKDIQTALNSKPKPETATGDENLGIIGRLLALVGYNNQFQEKQMLDGVRFNVYMSAVALPSDVSPEMRSAILSAIEQKFTDWMASEKSQISWEDQSATSRAPSAEEIQKPEGEIEVSSTTPIYKEWVGAGHLIISPEPQTEKEIQPSTIPLIEAVANAQSPTDMAAAITNFGREDVDCVIAFAPIERRSDLRKWANEPHPTETIEIIAKITEASELKPNASFPQWVGYSIRMLRGSAANAVTKIKRWCEDGGYFEAENGWLLTPDETDLGGGDWYRVLPATG